MGCVKVVVDYEVRQALSLGLGIPVDTASILVATAYFFLQLLEDSFRALYNKVR
jgi:hypothetical protein